MKETTKKHCFENNQSEDTAKKEFDKEIRGTKKAEKDFGETFSVSEKNLLGFKKECKEGEKRELIEEKQKKKREREREGTRITKKDFWNVSFCLLVGFVFAKPLPQNAPNSQKPRFCFVSFFG